MLKELIKRLEDLNDLNDTHMMLMQRFLKKLRPVANVSAYKSLYREIVVALNHLEHVSAEFNEIISEILPPESKTKYLKYKGFTGSYAPDENGGYYGEVVDTRDVITFQSLSLDEDEITQAFYDSIDDYLGFKKKCSISTLVKL